MGAYSFGPPQDDDNEDTGYGMNSSELSTNQYDLWEWHIEVTSAGLVRCPEARRLDAARFRHNNGRLR